MNQKLILPAKSPASLRDKKGKNPLEEITAHLSKLKYPIAGPSELKRTLADSGKIELQALPLKADAKQLEKIIHHIPVSFYPIGSAKEFEEKIKDVFRPRNVAKVKHPTTAQPPAGGKKGK